jgi:hypothetical protein
MVSSPDDTNIPDLGFVSTNLGELSTDDAMTSWGWGQLVNQFSRGWSS